jgi:Sortase and related acyltransferases
MRFVHCTHARHTEEIRAIFNEAILNTTALFDYEPRSSALLESWFAVKEEQGYPIIGIEADDGTLLGFASYGMFRSWPAYKYTVEHSVYVHKEHRGKGLGRRLLEKLLEEAEARDVHVMVGVIESSNTGSIALHEALGFTHAGTLEEVGFKFGRWLDVSFYQRVLRTPMQPVDG